MTISTERAGHTVTLVTGKRPEEAQAAFWRPIAWKWPAFAAPPTLEVLTWSDIAEGARPIAGAAALIAIEDPIEPIEIFRLLNRLGEQGVPTIALSIGEHSPVARASSEGLVVVPSDADPAMVAGMLYALAERQEHVELLRSEVSVSRRFQGGLRGEIEKIHEELQLAASVQREFMPRQIPSADTIDLQVLFRPCGYVSGDIYDVQRLDEHHIGFFVADAVGHGVPAALMTMVLCRCLVTTSCENGCVRPLSPGQVMRTLNEDLIRRHGDAARVATAVYGVIDTRTRHISVAGAGHPYPLVLRADGSIIRLETSGGILGLFEDDDFGEARVTLEDGDMFVVYSDGFETAFPPPGADGHGRKKPNLNYIDRFQDMAEAWRGDGLNASVRRLCEQLDQQSGSLHQRDDLTAMMIVPTRETALDKLFRGERSSPLHEPVPGPAAPLG